MPQSSLRLPWQLLCMIDGAKALLPFQERLRRWKDSAVGYNRDAAKDRATLRDGLKMLQWLGDVRGRTVLEIGTGWQPMLPVLYSLAGARVLTADLHRLIRPETFQAALDAVAELEAEICGQLAIEPERLRLAVRPFGDYRARMQELGISYLAPCDCRFLPLRSGSVDIFASRAVLEHIPPPVLEEILREAARVLRPEGRMLHLIDYSDHWSHRDRRISAVHFLRHPDWLFRLICLHPQNYHNRLRHAEFLHLIRAAGFAVQREHRRVDQRALEALGRMEIQPRFRRFPPEELATTEGLILSVRDS